MRRTCLSDTAAQEAGLAGLLLQLCLHCAQLGILSTCLTLEGVLLCLQSCNKHLVSVLPHSQCPLQALLKHGDIPSTGS